MLARVVAVGYTGAITTGPLLLGIAFMLVVSWLARLGGMGEDTVAELLAMVSYDLIASQLVVSVISTALTRYVSDMLYAERDECVLPSLLGALTVALPVGGVIYGAFLLFAGVAGELLFLNETLFLTLVAVWLEVSYLTAVKDYRGVLGGYSLSMLLGVVGVVLVSLLGADGVEWLLVAVDVGYGLMMVTGLVLLVLAFPRRDGPAFTWLAWLERFPALVVYGVSTCAGLFCHLLFGWANPQVSQQIYHGLQVAPTYDIPALYAMLTMLPTTITFVAITETEFYPAYRRYFDLLNGTGSVTQVDAAQDEMLGVMYRELTRLGRRQLVFTIAAVGFGTIVLDALPLGFSTFMNARFRILCVGYGTYAVANVLSLMLMYFSAYRGVARSGLAFAAVAVGTSAASLLLPASWLGYGFAVSAVVYYVVALVELRRYVKRLPAAVFGQRGTGAPGDGPLTRLGTWLERTL